MSFESVSRNYLRELQNWHNEAARTGQFTGELSYRPLLDRFLRDVAHEIHEGITAVFEPKNQYNAGHPDWRFYDGETLAVFGYAEGKGLDINEHINIAPHVQQLERYLSIGHRLMLTDGLEFVFFNPTDQTPLYFDLIDKPVRATDWSSYEPNQALWDQFCAFFATGEATLLNEPELVEGVARRALAIAEGVLELADLPDGAGRDEIENHAIDIVSQLKTLVQNHHDPALRNPRRFAHFVAQVLSFGLLYAHRVVSLEDLSPQDLYNRIGQFWTEIVYRDYSEHLRPFRSLMELLHDELERLGIIGTWFEDCRLFLAHASTPPGQREVPDYHSLFERFLTVFDPDTRFDFGAFYTPLALARFAVKLTAYLARTEFDGLSLYASTNKLIDPCCGTGTFIEQLIEDAGEIEAFPRIIGFEILPAPYALAHYRLSMLREGVERLANVSIILTNTLSDELERALLDEGDLNLVQQEQQKARELSRPPITLIIGNPPSTDSPRDSSGPRFSIMQQLIDDFRPPETLRTNRQNIQKQIQNEFIKFLRWSCNKLTQSRPSMLCMVLPASFAEQTSYQWTRQWLCNNFQKLWLLDIDLDGRTGIRSSSLFKTLQGRLLLVALASDSNDTVQATEFQYASMTNLERTQKIQELERDRDNNDWETFFTTFPVPESTYTLRPLPEYDREMYLSFWPIYQTEREEIEEASYIFSRHCSGVKFAPTAMFVHVNSPVLQRRTRDIAHNANHYERIREQWFSGQDRPPARAKFSDAVRNALRNVLSSGVDSYLRPYSYRPLFNLTALISDDVLTSLRTTQGGGTRSRPELRRAYSSGDTIGFAVAPAPKDIGESLHRFVSFCWHLPDNDLCKRQNAHIFCNQFPNYKPSRGEWDDTIRCNIGPMLLRRLEEIGEVSPDDVVFYSYAVLCSDFYLDAFEGALFTTADAGKCPRIPIAADAELFMNIAQKGKELANLETAVCGSEDERVLGYFERYIDLFTGEFQLHGFKMAETGDGIILTSQSGTDLTIAALEPEVINFTVSGYNVIQQWLKMHSYRYSRMSFTRLQFLQFLGLLHRIREQIRITREVDQLLTDILSGDVPIIRP